MKHSRIVYGILAVLLFAAECIIGAFFHDGFIRSYFGDVLVVVLLYALLRAALPVGVWRKLHRGTFSLWNGMIFLFAVLVECLQGIHIVDLLGLGEMPLMRTIIGTSFAWMDIVSYAVGCIGVCVIEWAEMRLLTAQAEDGQRVLKGR